METVAKRTERRRTHYLLDQHLKRSLGTPRVTLPHPTSRPRPAQHRHLKLRLALVPRTGTLRRLASPPMKCAWLSPRQHHNPSILLGSSALTDGVSRAEQQPNRSSPHHLSSPNLSPTLREPGNCMTPKDFGRKQLRLRTRFSRLQRQDVSGRPIVVPELGGILEFQRLRDIPCTKSPWNVLDRTKQRMGWQVKKAATDGRHESYLYHAFAKVGTKTGRRSPSTLGDPLSATSEDRGGRREKTPAASEPHTRQTRFDE